MAEGRRKVIRERVGRSSLGESGRVDGRAAPSSGLVGKRWVAFGAKKSVRDPVRRRAIVEVRATVVTCVDGRPAGGGALGGYDGGVNVWMMVPRLLM